VLEVVRHERAVALKEVWKQRLEIWRSPISIAIAGRSILDENFVGRPKSEASAGAVVE
jgi:hypothetical protein